MAIVRKRRKGFTLIELLIVIAVIGILAAIAIPNLLSSRKNANEGATIGAVRTLDSAEELYRVKNPTYGTVAQLGAGHFIDPDLGSGTKESYNFAATPVPGAEDAAFYVTATPANSGAGTRSYYSDETGVLWMNDIGGTATADTNGAAPTTGGGNWMQVGN
ncbi:MAG TPA: prepilin-type N-terminal cleavage/methylation domain-containing protein [Armatimonadota bacterium]|nr:prepilin-type N-terminal cleavage/methylation domain-containing protein [Armatimonadota bacterium]